MSYPSRRRRPYRVPTVVHNIVCQHRIEIEVWPSEAEVYFQDEKYVDPVNTQVRFQAAVYNAPTSGVTWEVTSIGGGPAAGAIDPAGLYTAPPKGSLAHGTTDIIIATAVDDPLRKAFGRVTLVGFGPEPAPQPKLEVFPKQVYLYYWTSSALGDPNSYIDASNKMQLFRANLRNTPSSGIDWYVQEGAGSNVLSGGPEPWYRYQAPNTGSDGIIVTISARLQGDPGLRAEAKAILINYQWPGIIE